MTREPATLLRHVEVEGRLCDLTIKDGVVSRVESAGSGIADGSEVLDGAGGALLPGLHDHHVHLLALASARASVDCGAGLTGLAGSPGDGWIRGVNYHEDVAGDLDRHVLDRWVRHRPVRVQHRSGALWILNSAALELVGHVLDDSPDVERDADGHPTGRLWRYDARLRPALPASSPDLGALGRELAGLGIIGVTDATPDLDDGAVALLAELPQHVTVLGAATVAHLPVGMVRGPAKLLLRDHDLPDYDSLADRVRAEHLAGRPVAVHCVTRESLVLTLAVLEDVGTLAGDRVEHAAIAPPEVAAWMGRLGVRAVTQPDFLRTRGATYLREVAGDDLPHLYPFARLLDAGVPTTGSSDAPYGEVDPWRIIASAASRTICPEEAVPASMALAGYLSGPLDPGGPPRRITAGAPADLVLLDAPLDQVLTRPTHDHVRATWIRGMPA